MKKGSISKKTLKKQYEFVCNEYIRKFIDKQEIEFDGWIGNDIGGVASFINQYYFNLQDIIWDINSEQAQGLILSWQDDSLDNTEQTINYFSYSKGLRYSDLKNDEE